MGDIMFQDGNTAAGICKAVSARPTQCTIASSELAKPVRTAER